MAGYQEAIVLHLIIDIEENIRRRALILEQVVKN